MFDSFYFCTIISWGSMLYLFVCCFQFAFSIFCVEISKLHYTPEYTVGLSYTLWSPLQVGLATYYNWDPSVYGIGKNDVDLPDLTYGNGSVVYPNVNSRSGFKVNIGKVLDYDCLEFSARYTRFANLNNPLQGIAYAQFSLPDNPSTLTAVWGAQKFPLPDTTMGQSLFEPGSEFLRWSTSSWNNGFNRIDLLLGRRFFMGERIEWEASGGFLGAWDDQTLTIMYGTGDAKDPNANGTVDSRAENLWINRQSWWSVGPYLRGTTVYIVYQDIGEFGILFGSGFSLPCGETNALMAFWARAFKEGQVETRPFKGDPIYAYRDLFRTLSPMVEAKIGLIWNSSPVSSFLYSFFVGWEQQYWFDHNYMFNAYQYTVEKGGYSMQGLTVDLSTTF